MMNDKHQILTATQEVFKLGAGFYLTILQRSNNKHLIPQMLDILKSYLNANVQCCFWLLHEFCNFELLKENLLESSQKEMRKFVVGLLYCSMLKVYEMEKANLNSVWLNKGQEYRKTVLGNFIMLLLNHLMDVRAYAKHHAQYFQLFARFSSLGPEAREFLNRARIVGRFMDFFFDEASPHQQTFRDMSDLDFQPNKQPDLGLPTVMDKKQMNYYSELWQKKRE